MLTLQSTESERQITRSHFSVQVLRKAAEAVATWLSRCCVHSQNSKAYHEYEATLPPTKSSLYPISAPAAEEGVAAMPSGSSLGLFR